MKNVMAVEFAGVFNDIYKAYSMCNSSAMKRELWRYCILYKYGGIYADSDVLCKCDPNIFNNFNTFLVCVPEIDGQHLSNWAIAAPPNSPVMKKVIETSLNRIFYVNYGIGQSNDTYNQQIIFYASGKEAFTAGVEGYLKENHLPVFINKFNYVKYKNQTMICFKPDVFSIQIASKIPAMTQPALKNKRVALSYY
jgi:hypothetical protein